MGRRYYYYKVEKDSTLRGYTRTVYVYTQSQKTNRFILIGFDNKINTSSFVGDVGIACKILHELYGYRWEKGNENYALDRKDVFLIELP